MKIRVFIAEDEPHSLDRLRSLLEEYSDFTIVGEAQDGIEAIKKIDRLKPDLLFLDIQIPGATGFQVLEKIKVDPMVVFVTAYDRYAIRAFEENAIDYILKPFSPQRFSKAVKKIVEKNYRLSQSDVDRLKLSLKEPDYLRRFVVKLGDEIRILPEADVYFFKADNKYVFLHTKDKHYFFDLSLKDLEQNLDPDKFCRIHKSFIVSIDKIKKLKRWFHGEFLVEMKDATESTLKVSRGYKNRLQAKLRF